MGMELVLRKWMEKEKDYSISYSTYMNLALYDEEYGYYMKEREKIGRNGDFFTSSNISSVFARTFARFFIRLVQNGEIPPNVCEIGGGTGRFAYDVLQEWKQLSPVTYAELRYSIIEVSPFHRRLQKRQLGSFQNISQYKSYKELGESFTGIVFSNELFDAFPVEVIEKRAGILYEVRITYTEQRELTEVLRPLEQEVIRCYLRRHKIELYEGQRFEVPIAMETYLQEIIGWLKGGLFISVDYGYTRAEWMHPAHHEGSLRGYYDHRIIQNPLKYPGEMDITAHIHWDELKKIGEESSLHTVWHTKQREFLLAAGILEQLASHQDSDPFSEKQKQNRAVRSMILHGGISDAFDVVMQKKGMPHFDLKHYLHI
ncbi:class I SAM-dependent methyltransferase [Bacillus pseudomycoides]|uniref:SAM-dependent methyltransferase n=1 Tax=Bacillus pseudomycoides TaxID=64104 RepID=A0A2B5RQY9_9BACI|nr:SAM-dependent methyltransferase [Bacillus pseudomycoides]PDY49115.1 SAM-dependent methyltransferase [Bacillus pseudomycoides]PED72913.1 SAM-dependent methyltransferase [Bacillus pseudomycoides]PEI45138.1 SAM-dependent methyltransferase [Bacillus pseudomycoides]PEJ79432.1 SAM-dependent methyltransferase [Bacillus pseudomycoides]PEM20116.1 SAM-dependent methyltransferase [Bacillus pseudomycoides]